MPDTLHIPPRINFECQSCGNCCHKWPVPCTDEDVLRITELSRNSELLAGDSASLFKYLYTGNDRLRGYTHTLEKNPSGACAFLSEQNLCRLQELHGYMAKPAMCRLFPYTFTPTPSGTYLYVSYASTAVLRNSGSPLSSQRTFLEKQYSLFRELFPNVDSDWSQAQLIDGVALPWNRYLEIEKRMLTKLSDDDASIFDALQECSSVVQEHLPAGSSAETTPPLEASDNMVDLIILEALSRLYWPRDIFNDETIDLSGRNLITRLVNPPANITIFDGIASDLIGHSREGNVLSGELVELLRRFVYCRIFGKLFFARGYGHLSLLAGIHHLSAITVLIALQARLRVIHTGRFDLDDLFEIVRVLERRLTQMSFSAETSAVLEVLLSSPARQRRLLAMVS